MAKLRTFLELDNQERLTTFEAMAALLRANLLVRLVPPRKWRARFGAVASCQQERPAAPADLEALRRVRHAIHRALRNVPGAPNCLPQALAARWMLERRGIRASLCIAAARAPGSEPRFHAWLKVGPEWVTGDCDESSYSLMTDAATR